MIEPMDPRNMFGGLSFPMYSLCLSLVNDQLPEGQRVAASSVYVFTTGLGAILGPLGASVAIIAFGDEGFWWTLVGVHVAVGLFAVYRMRVRRPIPVDQQSPFALSPPRASAVVARLASRTWRRTSNGVERVRPGAGEE
jgi:MFS family permease